MKSLIYLVVVMLLLANCSDTKKVSDIGKFKPQDEGWVLFNFPRTSMSPGYLFRIKDGETRQREIITLKANRALDSSYIRLPDYYQSKTLKGNFFLKFLFLISNDSSFRIKGDRTKEVTMSFGESLQESYSEPTIDSLVKKADINWKDSSKYYIIQSTVSTKSIIYKTKRNAGWDINLILSFKAFNPQIGLSKSKTDSTSIIQDFNKYYRIYYTAYEITPMGVSIGNIKNFAYRKVLIKFDE